VADEKHTQRRGQREYVAVTAAGNCFLGASLSSSADREGLEQAYGVFRTEALQCDPDYQPDSVTTDGWEATRSAWSRLFPGITLILCFLHAVLKIRDLCRSRQRLWQNLQDRLWQVYHATSKQQFAQRLRRLLEWSKTADLPERIAQQLRRIHTKSKLFQRAFNFDNAYRTSNCVDRPMNYLDRVLYAMQYFHGSAKSGELNTRSMAILWNFHPYGRKTRAKKQGVLSPFEELNGFRYHDNWLRNLLIASSLNGRRANQHKLLRN